MSLNSYHSDSDQFKNVKGWNSNGNVEDGSGSFNLLPPLQPGGRHESGKNKISFAL